ncbi:ADP-ribose pyrophosphatase [Caloramator mitchellensis]|uniref:ADP-ribose pyrophosphatase n=1 Tax=Caloramator mitchellensis TaxID=908809 RepID=A0A0R3JTF9_CALMK|nr:NUDIX hydrolase [Caloramator mitchellensis]KRQ86816.1 ADP-ribose pyrophosphatase [Caloramator mitchellensis]
MQFFEKTIEKEYIYNGRILNLRRDKVLLPDDKIGNREIIEHNGGVGIVAITKDKKVILIRQFRKPTEEVLIEIPAGKLEKGEKPLDCAIRELEEETGKIPKSLRLLTRFYPSPGYSSEILYIYFCDEYEEGKVNLDEGEHLEAFEISIDEAINLINSGQIKDAKTIIGILMVKELI